LSIGGKIFLKILLIGSIFQGNISRLSVKDRVTFNFRSPLMQSRCRVKKIFFETLISEKDRK
jgi:hypothetical protein